MWQARPEGAPHAPLSIACGFGRAREREAPPGRIERQSCGGDARARTGGRRKELQVADDGVPRGLVVLERALRDSRACSGWFELGVEFGFVVPVCTRFFFDRVAPASVHVCCSVHVVVVLLNSIHFVKNRFVFAGGASVRRVVVNKFHQISKEHARLFGRQGLDEMHGVYPQEFRRNHLNPYGWKCDGRDSCGAEHEFFNLRVCV